MTQLFSLHLLRTKQYIKKDTKFNNRKHNPLPIIKNNKKLYQILRNLSNNNIKHKIDNKNNESNKDWKTMK